jgi:hypothetical protein
MASKLLAKYFIYVELANKKWFKWKGGYSSASIAQKDIDELKLIGYQQNYKIGVEQ